MGKRWKYNYIKAAEGLVESNVLIHACVSSQHILFPMTFRYCTSYRQLRWYHKDVHDGCCTGSHFAFRWTVALGNHPECEQQAENNSVNHNRRTRTQT